MENSLSRDLLTLSFSSFFGAFFAYLFTRIAEFFSKVYQRQVKHYNSLINLETQLSEIGGITEDNIFIVSGFIEAITSGHVYFNNLRPLPIDKSHYENLYDLDLINLLFTYNYEVRKINDDTDTIVRGYDKIETAYTQKHITKREYQYNCNNLASTLLIHKLFLTKFQDKTVNLLARVRIEIKIDKPFGLRLQAFFTKTKGSKITDSEINIELEKIKKEIKESRDSSQIEIDKILKEAGV